MVTAMVWNSAPVVDTIDLWVARSDCFCFPYVQRCCKPNSLPVAVKLVVFVGVPFVDMQCEQMMQVKKFSIQSVIMNAAEYHCEYSS